MNSWFGFGFGIRSDTNLRFGFGFVIRFYTLIWYDSDSSCIKICHWKSLFLNRIPNHWFGCDSDSVSNCWFGFVIRIRSTYELWFGFVIRIRLTHKVRFGFVIRIRSHSVGWFGFVIRIRLTTESKIRIRDSANHANHESLIRRIIWFVIHCI